MRENIPAADEILDLYFPVGTHGFVSLIDYMGGDEDIESAARVSYTKGTRQVSDTASLIRYLVRSRHDSPGEMVSLKFHLKMPLFVIQQLLRHRTAKINMSSFRYSEVEDDFLETKPHEWRLQSNDNKQGSSGFLPTSSDEVLVDGSDLSRLEKEHLRHSFQVYEQRIRNGIAREQARKDIPVSTYSTLYWKMDLRNLLHFLGLRCDSHAQQEIRDYANIIAGMVKRVAPIAFQAWVDYSYASRSFSRLELDFLNRLCLYSGNFEEKRREYELLAGTKEFAIRYSGLGKREYGEFWQKFSLISIPSFDLDLSKAKKAEEMA